MLSNGLKIEANNFIRRGVKMTDMEKLLMVYGSVVFCRDQFLPDDPQVKQCNAKKLIALTIQINTLRALLKELPFDEVLQCGQKDFYSFL